MRPVFDQIRLTKGETALYAHVISRVSEELDTLDLALVSVDHAEFMDINRRYQDRGWYALHDHYGHASFLGLAVLTKDGSEVAGLLGSRATTDGSKSFGAALFDLSFIYPAGTPEGAQDRFQDIPTAAMHLRGRGIYMGGFWLNPAMGRRSGLAGSALLSYLTRAMYAAVLGTQDPDYAVCMVIDNILRGREKGRSILDRYGFPSVAPGPLWVNHYPGEDLAMNVAWIDRAKLVDVILQTAWVGADEFRTFRTAA